jgi:hypothetical protein
MPCGDPHAIRILANLRLRRNRPAVGRELAQLITSVKDRLGHDRRYANRRLQARKRPRLEAAWDAQVNPDPSPVDRRYPLRTRRGIHDAKHETLAEKSTN